MEHGRRLRRGARQGGDVVERRTLPLFAVHPRLPRRRDGLRVGAAPMLGE